MNNKDKISRYEKAEKKLLEEKYGSKLYRQKKVAERLKNRAVSKKEAHARDYSDGPHDYDIDLGEESMSEIEEDRRMFDHCKTKHITDMNEEELNHCLREHEVGYILWPCENLLDHTIEAIFTADKKRKMNNPNNYTDYDALMDWISKINDRREGKK